MIVAAVTIIMTADLLAEDSKVKLSGDLRYRHETIDTEGKDARHRHRVRARVAISGQVNEELNGTVEISSGSDDPVSNNQSLDNAFSTKNLGLNLAYMSYKPNKVEGLKILAGKMKNPFLMIQKEELIWDPDMNPEGLAFKFNHAAQPVDIFFNAGYFWVEERSSDDDSYLIGGQGGLTIDLMEGAGYLTAGAGYYNYENIQGYAPVYDDDSFGNTLDTNDLFVEDFDQIDFFAEAGTKVQNIPVAIFADLVTNTAADSNNTGWLIGTTIGKTKKPGSWKFRYQYKKQEANSVFATFTDSDFLGGGTNGKGHEFNFNLQIMDAATLGITYFVNQIDLDNEMDYKRLQADIAVKFK